MLKYSKYVLIALFSLLLFVLICTYLHHAFTTNDLLKAIENEDVLKVEQLLKEGADPNSLRVPPSKFWNFLEYSQDWPLSIACKTGNPKMVELLIEYGANVEPSAEAGVTPLQATLFYFQPDDPEIVAMLLKNGAKTEYPQNELAVLDAAKMKPYVYDKTKANGTVFSGRYDESTAMGITKIVDMLIDGKDVDIEIGVELLKASVQNENLFLTKYLMGKGCDPNEKDWQGNSPLDYAIKTNNADLVSIVRHQSGDGSNTGDGSLTQGRQGDGSPVS